MKIAMWPQCLDVFAGIKRRQRLGLCYMGQVRRATGGLQPQRLGAVRSVGHLKRCADFTFRLLTSTTEKACMSVVLDSRPVKASLGK